MNIEIVRQLDQLDQQPIAFRLCFNATLTIEPHWQSA